MSRMPAVKCPEMIKSPDSSFNCKTPEKKHAFAAEKYVSLRISAGQEVMSRDLQQQFFFTKKAARLILERIAWVILSSSSGSFNFTCTWSKNVHLYVLFWGIGKSQKWIWIYIDNVLEHVLFSRLREAKTPYCRGRDSTTTPSTLDHGRAALTLKMTTPLLFKILN